MRTSSPETTATRTVSFLVLGSMIILIVLLAAVISGGMGIKAVILALFFILVYIGLRFNMRFAPGAVVALFHDVAITMGILVLIREEITLTILAALLTIVGYSLNDTIVVFDRVRENLKKRRKEEYKTILDASINETLPRTVLTSGTTLVTLLALFLFGGAVVAPFALVLILGITIGTFSSIFVASPALLEVERRVRRRERKRG